MPSWAIPQHPVQSPDSEVEDLGLSVVALEVLHRIGFFHPTPIQRAVIPPALDGKDILGLAETGSGKTAAFCLPVAERLFHGRAVRGLILAPTREIALQTQAFLELFGEGHGLRATCLIGGVSLKPQIDDLRRGVDVVVATPGRLYDHLERGNIKLDKVEELVLDEADHMLDMGFLPQVQRILQHVPKTRQTRLFSATMPPAIERLVQGFMNSPVRIDLQPEGKAASGIQHRLYLVEPENKKACLLALLHQELGSTLVFIRRKADAEWLSNLLEREGHPVEAMHGDLSQSERIKALQGFREGQHRILVATDVAARGIDVPGIRHIVNFDLPETPEDYIHRAGRTARGSSLGIVSSIASWLEKPQILEIEHTLGEKLPRCTVTGVPPYVELAARPQAKGGRRRRLL
jgi:ATP-dependent RNA helicase RhlE